MSESGAARAAKKPPRTKLLRKRYGQVAVGAVRHLAGLAAKGPRIHYLTGNHNGLLRTFADPRLGRFYLENKPVLDLPHGRTRLFQGDVFDATMHHAGRPAPRGPRQAQQGAGEKAGCGRDELQNHSRRHCCRPELPLRGLRPPSPARNLTGFRLKT